MLKLTLISPLVLVCRAGYALETRMPKKPLALVFLSSSSDAPASEPETWMHEDENKVFILKN